MAKPHEVLSPDGFTIEFDPTYYPSKKEALAALDKWMTRYKAQGYYSSNTGRIPLNFLAESCTVRPVIVAMPKFRWDLFLRDYRAYFDKDVRNLKEIGGAFDVAGTTLSGLRTGRLPYVGPKTLDKILKGMGMYYEFYCEDPD